MQCMQQAHSECGAGAHATARRQVAIVMDFHPVWHLHIPQDFARRWMLNFIRSISRLNKRIDQPVAIIKKGWQIAAGEITIFIAAGRQHRSAVREVPGRIVGSAAKERQAKGCAANNHASN